MGQTPHTLLSLRGYWKIPCGGNTPSGPMGLRGRRTAAGGLEQSLVSISPWPAGLVAKRLVPHRSGEHRIRPTERRASARRHTLPGAPRLTVVLEPGLCLESEAEKSGNARTELGGSRKPSCQHNHRRRSPSLGDGPETVQHKRRWTSQPKTNRAAGWNIRPRPESFGRSPGSRGLPPGRSLPPFCRGRKEVRRKGKRRLAINRCQAPE